MQVTANKELPYTGTYWISVNNPHVFSQGFTQLNPKSSEADLFHLKTRKDSENYKPTIRRYSKNTKNLIRLKKYEEDEKAITPISWPEGVSVNLKKKGLSKICTSTLFWCSQTPRCYVCLNLTLLKYSFQCCRLGIYKMHWDSPWKWCQNWHQGPEWSNAFSLGGSRWTDWLRKVISIIWRQSGSSRQAPTLLPPPCCRTGKRGNAQYVTEWDW